MRLHTFGIGNGADEHLVKGCAKEGNGHFYFVYEYTYIAENVVVSLAKNSVIMKRVVINKIEVMLDNGEELD